jgi:transaldolase
MSAVHTLADAGVSVWLDDLGRHRLESGELVHLVDDLGVRGVTTNPSIFAAAVRDGSEYQERLSAVHSSTDAAVYGLMVSDVQDACTVLAGAYERTAAVDGRVSLEVDPRLAFDTDATIAAAARIAADVDRPNVMVKIPATREGLPAITATLGAGISVNVTLIFGLDRYRDVQRAWADGMAAAQANGHDVSTMASVASFFVSRLDAAVDKRLDALLADGELAPESHADLRGRAAVANARNAYRQFQTARASDQWRALESAGVNPQRPLWASTSTKDPSFSPTRYVDELVAADTVNTMPAATLELVLGSSGGRSATILDGDQAAADIALFDSLARVGIGYDEVVAELEVQGVQAFIDAWNSLLDLVGTAAR